MTRSYRAAALALLTIAAPHTTHAADLAVLGELPVVRTPMARTIGGDGSEDIPLPVTLGAQLNWSFEHKDRRRVFTAFTARGGLTGTADALLQLRFDNGFRFLLKDRERSQAFVDLGLGFEAVRVWNRTEGVLDVGTGPTLGIGWMLGEQRGTVLGARISAAGMSGGSFEPYDDGDETTLSAVQYTPSNATVALYAGRAF